MSVNTCNGAALVVNRAAKALAGSLTDEPEKQLVAGKGTAERSTHMCGAVSNACKQPITCCCACALPH